MPTASSFSFRIGETVPVDVQITPKEDVTDWTLIFTAVLDGGAGATAAAIKYTAGPGIAVVDGPNGLVRITIASADTLALAPGMYSWEVRRTDPGNNRVEAEGVLYLLPSTATF
jgi:hypothetical protein